MQWSGGNFRLSCRKLNLTITESVIKFWSYITKHPIWAWNSAKNSNTLVLKNEFHILF